MVHHVQYYDTFVNESYGSGIKNSILSEFFCAGFLSYHVSEGKNTFESIFLAMQDYVRPDDEYIDFKKVPVNKVIDYIIRTFELSDETVQAIQELRIVKGDKIQLDHENGTYRLPALISGLNSAWRLSEHFKNSKKTIIDVYHTGRFKRLEDLSIGKSDIIVEWEGKNYYGISLKTHTSATFAPVVTFMLNSIVEEDDMNALEKNYDRFLIGKARKKFMESWKFTDSRVQSQIMNVSTADDLRSINFLKKVKSSTGASSTGRRELLNTIAVFLKNQKGTLRAMVNLAVKKYDEQILEFIRNYLRVAVDKDNLEKMLISVRNVERISGKRYQEYVENGRLPLNNDFYVQTTKKLREMLTVNILNGLSLHQIDPTIPTATFNFEVRYKETVLAYLDVRIDNYFKMKTIRGYVTLSDDYM